MEFNKLVREILEEAKKGARCTKVTKKASSPLKNKKYTKCVKNPSGKGYKRIHWGDPNMRIKKSNPKRRKSFRARMNCDNPGPRWKPRYWACRTW